jgi:hypothetical protein
VVNLRLAAVLLLALGAILRLWLQRGDWRDTLEIPMALWFGYGLGESRGLRNGRSEVVREIVQRERRGRVMFTRRKPA